jgi:hypothetical protein
MDFRNTDLECVPFLQRDDVPKCNSNAFGLNAVPNLFDSRFQDQCNNVRRVGLLRTFDTEKTPHRSYCFLMLNELNVTYEMYNDIISRRCARNERIRFQVSFAQLITWYISIRNAMKSIYHVKHDSIFWQFFIDIYNCDRNAKRKIYLTIN